MKVQESSLELIEGDDPTAAARAKLPTVAPPPPPPRADQKNRGLDEDWHCCLRVGTNILICGRKRGRWPGHWFVGPDWHCMCCTYALVLVPTIAFLIFVGAWHPAVRWIGVATGLATLSGVPRGRNRLRNIRVAAAASPRPPPDPKRPGTHARSNR